MKPNVSEEFERLLYDPDKKAALLADIRGEQVDTEQLNKFKLLVAEADSLLRDYLEEQSEILPAG